MIYKNDNIEITGDYVKGQVKYLKEYFRYEIASQCMTGSDCDFENFKDNVSQIISLLTAMYNFYDDNDIAKVSEHQMGDLIIEREEEN